MSGILQWGVATKGAKGTERREHFAPSVPFVAIFSVQVSEQLSGALRPPQLQ